MLMFVCGMVKMIRNASCSDQDKVVNRNYSNTMCHDIMAVNFSQHAGIHVTKIFLLLELVQTGFMDGI